MTTLRRRPEASVPRLRFLPETLHIGRQLRTYCDARFKTIGLTLARGQVLLHLEAAKGRLPQGELTALLEVEHPTAIRLFDSLSELGLLERCPGDSDRRSKDIKLTEAGTELANQVRSMTDDILIRVMEGIPDKDIDVARDVLACITANIAAL
ncbi:MarR family winged helix-turn-helix transcriptional regulator [Rahnella sikkimica]|uniref:MarR family transcriptional regulator n=1 Tax=Rahnella sikkimica TaxID=1805933 RepID=A0A2L1UNI7_9GAMM|nr:MarR family transcriptional regulator [Rahnella sikkimica]AVF34494.1 MarR family transcriptional regulator [Rahnella sikkimica]